MLGFRFPENFNYPYIAQSMTEFWRRWHITLSTWFRDYLYIPLGGNRRSTARTYANLWVVFLLCGLWHGASGLMVTWGAYHGLLLVIERTPIGRGLTRLPAPLAHVYTVLAFMLGWLVFRATSLEQIGYYAKALVVSRTPETYLHVQEYFSADVRIALVAGVLFSMPVYPRLRGLAAKVAARGDVTAGAVETVKVAGLMGLLLLCAMSLGAGTHNPFIYFRF
jgi:alginate O-acetyltransferase complex protein AlgI